MGYLGNFVVYTLAMVGVMAVALIIFKNATSQGAGKSSKHLKVIDTLSIGQRKMLYVVSAGGENFLIAGDTDRTSLISKLGSWEEPISAIASMEDEDFSTHSIPVPNFRTHKDDSTKDEIITKNSAPVFPKSDFMDRSKLGMYGKKVKQNKQSGYNSVIRNLAEKMRG